MDQHNLRATEEEIGEFSFMDLVTKMYDNNPLEPFSLRMEAMTEMTPQDLRGLLCNMLVIGGRKLYNKPLELLTEEELSEIRKYFYSIGFDFENSLNKLNKEVTDYHEDGTPFQRTITINRWNFTFKTADLSLHPRTNVSKLSSIRQ